MTEGPSLRISEYENRRKTVFRFFGRLPGIPCGGEKVPDIKGKEGRNMRRKILCIALALSLLAGLTGCAALDWTYSAGKKRKGDASATEGKIGNATELTAGVSAGASDAKEADERFRNAYNTFALKLLKETAGNGTLFISPYSLYAALAMLQNGEAGKTLAATEEALGLPAAELNAYLKSMADRYMNGEQVTVSNSVWVEQSVQDCVVEEFLKDCVAYYSASVYAADFSRTETVNAMNRWIKEKSKDRIHDLVKDLNPSLVMTLFNCLTFDGKWKNEFKEENTKDAPFTAADGTTRQVQMMNGEAECYFKSNLYQGFDKMYEGDYIFRAILPNDGVSVQELLEKFSANSLSDPGIYDGTAIIRMPKVRFESETIELNGPLIKMGFGPIFSGADFSRMFKNMPVAVSEVKQKTFLEIDEKGTKAAAVTQITVKNECVMEEPHVVELNKPFLYMIVDRDANIPIFIGIYE